MGTSSFQQGQSIDLHGKQYGLKRKVSDNLWQLEDVRTGRIHEMTDLQLRAFYSQGSLTFVRDTHERTDRRAAHRHIPDRAWEIAKVRRMYVHAVLELPSTVSAVEPAIAKIWEQLGATTTKPSARNVLRWKSRYIASGKDIHALVDNNERKGNRTRRTPEELHVIVEDAVNNVFMTRERKTIQDALDHAIACVMKENKLRPASFELPLPTRRLVKRFIETIPAKDRCIARYGETAANKKFRAVLAHRTTERPLERAEIDHTRLDLMVIDDATGMPMGRPWMTACIDDYTRCILGIHLGFTPPSYMTVAKCLRNAFLPKVDLKEKYPDVTNDWEAHGVMSELVVDNGLEFHSGDLENACYSLGIEIHYSPRKEPWHKGKIERFFRTLNGGVAHGNPGTTFSNIFEKDDYNPEKHAVIRWSALQKIVRKWIADVYHQRPHRALQAPPAEYWRKNISLDDILLPDDPARLDAILGKCEQRKLTHKGIEREGLQYNSRDLVHLRERYGDNLKVDIRVDDTDLGYIVVLSPDCKQLFKVPANRMDYANGLTLWQHRLFKRHTAKQMRDNNLASWIRAKDEILALVRNEVWRKGKSPMSQGSTSDANDLSTVEEVAYPSTDATSNGDIATSNESTSSTEKPPQQNSSTSQATVTSSGSVRKYEPLYRERKPQQIEPGREGSDHDE